MNKVAIFLLLLLPLHPSSAVLINIDANKSLQYYLCDGQVELEDQTTLTLSSQLEHVLKPGLACIIHSLQNITIRGEGGSTSTIIKYQYVSIHVSIRINTYQYVSIRINTCINTYQYVSIRNNTCINTYQYMYQYVSIRINTCINTYQYVSIHVSIRINT